MKAQFYLAAAADKKNEHVIRLFVNSKGIKIQTSTGYKVQAKDWDKENARLKKGATTASGMKADYINAYLDRVRDVFCFTCFTGLRWSDVAALQRSDCYEDHIRVITKKTQHNTKIELNKYSKAILNKYRDSLLTGNAALPVISTQKMNDYLHELGQLAGLNTPIKQVYYCGAERREVTSPKWQWLTTHCGRRTFICNALALGIAPNVIMQWTGHSDYKAMLPYIAIADSTRVQAMDKFNI